ncbi:MAG TPA: hypothetical protein VFY06_03895 [Verrucomicrobiae bacterium]|nr:hypothetical protein [Verrucomicrobiae bacterium]
MIKVNFQIWLYSDDGNPNRSAKIPNTVPRTSKPTTSARPALPKPRKNTNGGNQFQRLDSSPRPQRIQRTSTKHVINAKPANKSENEFMLSWTRNSSPARRLLTKMVIPIAAVKHDSMSVATPNSRSFSRLFMHIPKFSQIRIQLFLIIVNPSHLFCTNDWFGFTILKPAPAARSYQANFAWWSASRCDAVCRRSRPIIRKVIIAPPL